MPPKASIVIATFNNAPYIEQAIESALAQNYPDFEVIVVDDGSTDDTRARVNRFGERVRYVYQTNQERSAARNHGAALSRGEFLAFLDGDDILFPDKLAVQAAALERRKDAGLVASGFQYMDGDGDFLQESRPWVDYPEINLESLLFSGLTAIHAVLFRKEWFERVAGFDPKFSGPEDMDLWYRLSLAGCSMIWEPAVVASYRLHGSNSSRNIQRHYAMWTRVLDKLFQSANLPSDILKRKIEIYAYIKLAEAGRLYGARCGEMGKQSVEEAIQMDPRLLDKEDRRLKDMVIVWEKNIWNTKQDDFFDYVVHYLPDQIGTLPNFYQSLRIDNLKFHFYHAHQNKKKEEVINAWFQIGKKEPRWLLNRGGWSILFQAIGLKQYRKPA